MKKFLSFFTMLLIFVHSIAGASEKFNERPEVQKFIQHMVQKHHFDANQLNQWFSKVSIQPKILAAIAKPAEKLPWYKYEPIFVTSKRINEGVVFWDQNKPALEKAEKQYGIPAEVIIAIIGVETFYGRQQGQYNVLDSLSTLAFDYPPRSKFFLSELEEFLLLAREEKWDPSQIRGSYAGAMGKPQFMPSSYRKFAVDFSAHGKRDLLNDTDDSIGSVANYFKEFGWEKGGEIIIPALAIGEKFKPHIASKFNPEPTLSLNQVTELGIKLNGSHKLKDQPFALIVLEGKSGPEYWLGAKNFYVITRYNHSDHYAMAVYNLSQKIKEKHG